MKNEIPRFRVKFHNAMDHRMFMYGGEDQPWDERGNLIPTDLPVSRGEIVLPIRSVPSWSGSITKILTSRGTVGWIHSGWLEVVE